ncbi:hypothetical protein GGR57DRAFT_407509 [Xylariaceae sp. FL1272]|nr:hypothetical protein GGR57DRAFT_407509 [Xylariaceae sp. FL1272]
MESSSGSNFFLPLLHHWNAEFSTKRPICRSRENTSYVDTLLNGFDQEQLSRGTTTGRILLKLFMKGAKKQHKKLVKHFCRDIATVSISRTSSSTAHTKLVFDPANATFSTPVSFLIDISNDARKPRASQGLSADKLYLALLSSRFQPDQPDAEETLDIRSPLADEDHNTRAIEDTNHDSEALDADIRIFYIRDLNPSTVYSLAATASRSQTKLLQDFIPDYLSFKPNIRASIASSGVSLFTLDFQLPFYSLQRSTGPRHDPRGLRKYENVSYLSLPTIRGQECGEGEYLYEAQMSLCISGYDDYTWTGYFLIDLFYKKPGKIPRMEDICDYEGTGNKGYIPDPLTVGSSTFNDMIRAPREYFLRVLTVRIQEVASEWVNLEEKLQDSVENFRSELSGYTINLRTGIYTHHMSRQRCDERETGDHLTDSLCSTISLLEKLSKLLRSSIKSWDKFTRGPVNMFVHPSYLAHNIPEPATKSLVDIGRIFGELQDSLAHFESLRRQCEGMRQNIRLAFEREKRETDHFQKNTSEELRALSQITFWTSPFMITAAMLSVRDGFLPVRPSFGSYIIVLLIWCTILCLFLQHLREWPLFQTLLKSLKSSIFWRKELNSSQEQSSA